MLPFRAATPGEANEALALVVTDVVSNRLALLKGVVVIASDSMARLPDAQLDARETGRKLNAQFLLRGSAAYAGDQVSTEAKLVDAVSGAQQWSTSFDHSVKDVALFVKRSSSAWQALCASRQNLQRALPPRLQRSIWMLICCTYAPGS